LHERAPQAPTELVAICERAMAHDWHERYPDMGALAEDLRAYLEHRVVKAHRVGAWIELEKWIERNRRFAVSMGAGIVAILVGLVSSLVLRERANHNAVLAHENELLALARADEVLRLSALRRLEDLVEEADRLWPITPALAGRYSTWLSSAKQLLSELPSYERTLVELRSRAHPGATENAGWTFDSTEDRWWHDQLVKLIDGLRSFADPEHGLVSAGISAGHGWGIARRLAFAETLAERSVTGPEARARWDEVLASIHDQEECPWYSRVELTPQIGLLPIGRDPVSGLWEFAHLQSGEPAVRRADGQLTIRDETGLVLVLLPGGSFRMGAQLEDEAKPNYDALSSRGERPVHPVQLQPFFLSKYEMTEAQWGRTTGANPSYWAEAPRRPVETVSWSQCTETCRQLGLTLPSEAQWEYGARGDTDAPWWSGKDPSLLAEVANLADRTYRDSATAPDRLTEDWSDGAFEPAPVGRFAPNYFGLHDVHGNVWEWCEDAFATYSPTGDPEVDPVRIDPDAPTHVARGGGFDNGAVSARSACRLDIATVFAGYYLGLRPARPIEK
jgi:formylglycine-generating enzyme required for sulfatase activity